VEPAQYALVSGERGTHIKPGGAVLPFEVVTIDGGEWIGGAGEFNKLSKLTSQEWDEVAALTRGKKEGGEGPNAN
jgi:hypothetical protein